MYEIRVNAMDLYGSLEAAIELLYNVLPPPLWAHKTSDLATSMTANEYLIYTVCLHSRGYDDRVGPAPGATQLEPVSASYWMTDFHVESISGKGRSPPHLVVEVSTSQRQFHSFVNYVTIIQSDSNRKVRNYTLYLIFMSLRVTIKPLKLAESSILLNGDSCTSSMVIILRALLPSPIPTYRVPRRTVLSSKGTTRLCVQEIATTSLLAPGLAYPLSR